MTNSAPAVPAINPSAIRIVNGHPTTTSLQVAETFGKLHKDVLKRIRSLLEELPAGYERNFAPIQIDVDLGHGRTRKDTAYRMDRKGFTLLALGLTGARALEFKVAYIDAFDQMEQQLQQPVANSVLVPADEDTIQLHYNRRPLLVYRHGAAFWYRAAHVGALVGLRDSHALTRALPPAEVSLMQAGNQKVTWLSHRGMLASLGRLRQTEAEALLEWLKLLLPGAFMPVAPALEADPVATQPAPPPARLPLHYPVEVLAEMNPHAYRSAAQLSGTDPRIPMQLHALCGMDSRSPTLDLLFKLTKAGYEMEACRLEVLAMRHLLERYLSISRDMARTWEARMNDSIVFKLSDTAQQLRAKGIPGF